jgi:hypothetical protein
MKIYLSGPITGMPDGNRLEFALAERTLRSLGHEVINPHRIANDGTWSHAMRQDIKALMDCDAIYLLKGWSSSRGACIEFHLATKLGLKTIVYGKKIKEESCER